MDFGLILGSGLGELTDEIEDAIMISYDEIPSFPVSTVIGHAGQLVCGSLVGKKVLAVQKRFHYYKGHSMQTVTRPVCVMTGLDAHSVIVTNAYDGVNESFIPGDLMLTTGHINFTSGDPLIGPNEGEIDPGFPDMSQAYTPDYQAATKTVTEKLGLDLREGVHVDYSGPTYETPAEIRMSRAIGADTVGTSAVSEVIVVAHSGLKVLGISCIVNLAADMQASLGHREVVEATQRARQPFEALVKEALTLS